MNNRKPIFAGILGGLALLIVYFGIVTVANSFTHAIEEFGRIWYWIALLTGGFGIQVGLYIYIRQTLKERTRGATAEVATAGGISTGSMIACCAHHVTDVLPILGLGAAAMFLTQYQTPFILLGVFSNLVGITIMLHLIQQHNLAGNSETLHSLTLLNMAKVRNGAIAVSVAIVAGSFVVTGFNGTASDAIAQKQSVSNDPIELAVQSNQENRVAIEVKPVNFSFTNPVTFAISLNTHSGSLNYDLTKISTLICDQGYEYDPLRWDGSPPGGHHRRGELVFPEFDHKVQHMQLVIKDVYDVPERVFDWTI
ncbi:MAG: hypothetical protein K9N46_13330 [Candidatus Marinimicrobia bacterium]|nr:hypothetical protein [Candidatus Neomarinimicrobiota bacterium]MCF7829764.1 hypothetical protein [Candidatus Neomarinimicrobiota bacterium]MCF7881714.1 hypothetical protein [Candidatus Neomarinimicrobiota bacterium]